MPTAKLKALYKRLGPTLFARAQRALKDDTVAQEVVQQVVIDLSKRGELPDSQLLTEGRKLLAKHLEKRGSTLDSMSPVDDEK